MAKLSVVLALALLFAAVYADITIDDFSVSSDILNLGIGDQSNTVTGNMVGGSRDLIIEGESGGCSLVPATLVDGGSAVFSLSNPATTSTNCRAKSTVQYDGNDNSPSLSFSPGLGLNLATATGVTLSVANDNNVAEYLVELYTDAGNVCSRTIQHQGSSSANFQAITIPIGDFSGSCTLSSINAIQIVLNPQIIADLDLNLRLVTIVQPALGAITVTVWDDCNCDGSLNNGEITRNAITITVTPEAGCATSAPQTSTTGTSGTVTFSNLNACTYTVAMVGQQQCTGASSSNNVVVTAGNTAVTQFGIFCPPQTGDLTGIVFVDCECDGTQASGEPGLGGVTVTISASSGQTGCSADRSETTDSSGQISFGALNACSYVVSITNGFAACSSQPTSRTVVITAGQTSNVIFSSAASSCSITAPATATVPCGSSTDESATGSPTVTGGCSVAVTNSDRVTQCDTTVCAQSSSFVRTWTVQDSCARSSTASQTINIEACPIGECPPCSVPTVSVPTVSPISVSPNPSPSPRSPSPRSPSPSPSPSRSCRQVCDDGDSSSASSVVASFVLAFAALVAAMVL